MSHVLAQSLCWAGLLGLAACTSSGAELDFRGPEVSLDLASLGDDGLRRVYGSTGDGSLGLPVAGGLDVDADGFADVALGAMQAAPGGVPGAGSIFLAWGDGLLSGAIDTATPSERFVRVDGSQPYEYTGSELWIDDVDGDGAADLLIARQNHSPAAGRRAAGALSIVSGGPALREQSAQLAPIALDEPPGDVAVLTLLGAEAEGRLGIWVRSGDVTGDGVADLLIGADQESNGAEHAGSAWLIAGGPHLNGRLHASGQVDLAAPEASPLAGYVARISPPRDPAPREYHFGASCQLADLDGNGRAEVLVSAALSRAGAILDVEGGMNAHGGGGPDRGRLFIAWDDNFPALPWPLGFELEMGTGPGGFTSIGGSAGNETFGEELLGGLDWDLDDRPDLFVGDLVGNLLGRPSAGVGYVIYDAARLRGFDARVGDLGALDPPIRTTLIHGADLGEIAADTAAQGDFSGDGVADLVVCSPHANPLRRHSAGALHVLYGRAGGFPAVIDLRAPPPREELDLLAVYGAHGSFGVDRGDTLCYSAASGDLDADGRTDLIVNEMVGNGLAEDAINVGNLLAIGAAIAGPPELETGRATR